MDDLMNRLRSLENETHRISSCRNNRPQLNEIEYFETKYGFKLPRDFVEFCLSEYGALKLEFLCKQQFVSDDLYKGIMVYGFGNNIPREVDIWSRTEDMIEAGYDEYIPFMVYIGGEKKCTVLMKMEILFCLIIIKIIVILI